MEKTKNILEIFGEFLGGSFCINTYYINLGLSLIMPVSMNRQKNVSILKKAQHIDSYAN